MADWVGAALRVCAEALKGDPVGASENEEGSMGLVGAAWETVAVGSVVEEVAHVVGAAGAVVGAEEEVTAAVVQVMVTKEAGEAAAA